MTNVTPLISPPADLLRNAIFVLGLALEERVPDHASIRRAHVLIQGALEQLSGPNLASIQAAATMLREAPTDQPEYRELFQRYARDTVAVILKAAVTGEIPEMWSEP